MQEREKNKNFIHYLPIYGCFATGLIYSAIGVIAILSFLKLKDGGADESRLFAFLNGFFIGKILVFVILGGTASWIIWRFYETINDPYRYGKNLRGIAKRTGVAISTVADILIAYAAFRFLVGTGNLEEGDQLGEQQRLVQDILHYNSGDLLIMITGIIILITALVQFLYGITGGYRERFEAEEFDRPVRKMIHFLGLSGYLARGVIIGITGFFYLKAGILKDAGIVVDTDKAFDFIGDNIGHVWFISAAVGTIFYGIFMFALGIGYDIDRD